jgi:hypothetical protein
MVKHEVKIIITYHEPKNIGKPQDVGKEGGY